MLALLSVAFALPLVEAEAGLDFLAYPGQTIELNGAGSGADDLEYRWTRVGGPPAELSDDSAPNPQFTPERPGTYTFELTVASGGEQSIPDRVSVVVAHTDAGEVHTGGCSSVAGGSWLLGLLWLRGRRSRRRSA